MKILEILTKKRILGNLGEESAAKFLKKNGYRILERNYVEEGYEVDIIARKNDILAFVEVKARTIGHESPYESRPAASVTPDKQRKIIKVASRYKRRYGEEAKMRFDIIEVFFEEGKNKPKEIKHLIGTFNVNTAYERFVPR